MFNITNNKQIKNLLNLTDKEIKSGDYTIRLDNPPQILYLYNHYLILDILLILIHFRNKEKINIDDIALISENQSEFSKKQRIGYNTQHRRKYKDFLNMLQFLKIQKNQEEAMPLVEISQGSGGYFSYKLNSHLVTEEKITIARGFLTYNLNSQPQLRGVSTYLIMEKFKGEEFLSIKTEDILRHTLVKAGIRPTKNTTVNRVEHLLDTLKQDSIIKEWIYKEIYSVSEIKKNKCWIQKWLDYSVIISMGRNIDTYSLAQQIDEQMREKELTIKSFAQKLFISERTLTKIIYNKEIRTPAIALKLMYVLKNSKSGFDV